MVAGKRMFSVAADMMEVQAILLAFDLLRGSLPQYRAMEIQSDSMMALQVARDMVNNPNGEGVLAITLQYVRDMEALRFSHILREGNGPADWVARDACLHEFVWVPGGSLPQPLLKLMLSDFLFDLP
ncbi:hypothetical protein HPP92_022685 [Vanilla planifolia]|uniref:RNase H type-1 domain-containing protein n=1 Tax=Vanilla planifolia TaxID=51239 RepID=A0A835PPJ1_VANPL|nr:hypothetical protein HPP92_022977 [Vanilla planifolia]KAG0459557.1 hypothetical protein HPP92_022685 [Vanilla planifolia]